MPYLLWIAVALAVIWLVARVVAGVAGALLNLLWIVAIVLFAIWLFGVITGSGKRAT